ncbi:FmdE family protein [Aggregatilineales bacterium SYSU G02658]
MEEPSIYFDPSLSLRFVNLLEQTSALHRHLCPRQVLGVRMGVLAGELLGVPVPQTNKRLYTFVETDGCFADGVSVAVNCWLGRRTMRLIDYGKVAATFVDTQTETAIRIAPSPQARELAAAYAPNERSRWHTMLKAYQTMPAEELLRWQRVRLTIDMRALISRAGVRVTCAVCGEEILNEREIVVDGQTVCKSCYDGAYYTHE